MSKEKTLEKMKSTVLMLQEKGKDFSKNPELAKEFLQKQKEINEECEALSTSDAAWVGEEYAKWFNVEIRPKIDKDITEAQEKMKGDSNA